MLLYKYIYALLIYMFYKYIYADLYNKCDNVCTLYSQGLSEEHSENESNYCFISDFPGHFRLLVYLFLRGVTPGNSRGHRVALAGIDAAV